MVRKIGKEGKFIPVLPVTASGISGGWGVVVHAC
jgi:hypothetical protein